jgi:molybdenum cofactor biosynthesis enzyme MoaA
MTNRLAEVSDAKSNSMAGWLFSDDDIREALLGSRLLNPSIDLSNPCNLNCPYCFVEEKDSERKLRFKDELSLDEQISVIDDFYRSGARTVNIVGAGEPTIDIGFERIITEIARRNMTPVVFTNGIRLADHPNLLDMLYEVGATLVMKYDSADPHVQDLVAGRMGYTALRNQAIEGAFNRGFQSYNPTRLGFDIIAIRGIHNELSMIHRFCRRHNIFPIIADFIPTGRTSHGEFVGQASLIALPAEVRAEVASLLQPLSAEERSAIYESLCSIDTHEFGIAHHACPAYYSGSPCTQQLGLYVDIHGYIWPCVARSLRSPNGQGVAGSLGNVREGVRASEVWRDHPYLRHIRTAYNGHCPYKLPFQPAADPGSLQVESYHSSGSTLNGNAL